MHAAQSLRSNLQKKTIPSLNGLRGLSAFCVAVAHASHIQHFSVADYAVILFFEISGVLITWLLLSEQESTGSIDQLSFMKRRTLRLFPAFYVCWALCLLVPGVVGRWWAFFYMYDFYSAWWRVPGTVGQVLAMCWSLGIEEKYYLLWPTVMKHCRRQTLIRGVLVLMVAVQIYHFVIYKLGYVMWAAWGFDTRVDAILLGSALALLLKSGWLPPAIVFSRTALWASVTAILVLASMAWVHRLGFGAMIGAYPLAILLMQAIAKPPRWLNNSVTSYAGKISYSLYLFNPLAIYYVTAVPWIHGRVLRAAIAVVASLIAAVISYHFVESPFLRIKDRARARQLKEDTEAYSVS